MAKTCGRYQPSILMRRIVNALNEDELLPFDHYFATMARSDIMLGRQDVMGVKSFFIRKGPWGAPFIPLCGLEEVLWVLEHLRLDDPAFLTAMEDMGLNDPEFLAWLNRERWIKVQVQAPPEGSLFVPNEPVVTFQGPLPHLRLVEGLAIEKFNFRSLVALKALRCVLASDGGAVLEFGRRRAQNHLLVSLYAYLGGCSATSNDAVRSIVDIPTKGTMGHEWVQSFLSEQAAFEAWISVNPGSPILLVDTIDTLSSGVPNAIKAFDMYRSEIVAAGGMPGIRLDSGDLAYLALASAKMLKEAGYGVAKIVLSSDLDELEIDRIRGEIGERAGEFGLDPDHVLRLLVWGVGTRLAVCYDNPALGGVAKLMEVAGDPVIKLSDTEAKVSIPGDNASAWVLDGEELVTVLVYPRNRYYVEGGHLRRWDGGPTEGLKMRHPNQPGKWTVLGEHHRLEPRQEMVFDSLSGSGLALTSAPTLLDVRRRIGNEVMRLDATQRKVVDPWPVKLSLTEDLYQLRLAMREQRVLHASQLR